MVSVMMMDSVETMNGETERRGGFGLGLVGGGELGRAGAARDRQVQRVQRAQGHVGQHVDQVTGAGIVGERRGVDAPGAAAHMAVELGQGALFEPAVDLPAAPAARQQAAELDQRQRCGNRRFLGVGPFQHA